MGSEWFSSAKIKFEEFWYFFFLLFLNKTQDHSSSFHLATDIYSICLSAEMPQRTCSYTIPCFMWPEGYCYNFSSPFSIHSTSEYLGPNVSTQIGFLFLVLYCFHRCARSFKWNANSSNKISILGLKCQRCDLGCIFFLINITGRCGAGTMEKSVRK